MKKIINIILLLLLITIQISIYSKDNDKRIYATVLDFNINKSVTAGFDGSTIAVILEEPLSLYYRLVDRLQIEKAMKELKFQVSDIADKDKVQEFGKMVGAELIITGSVVQFGKSITIATKAIDVETGEIIQTAKVSTNKVEEIPYLAETIVRRLRMSDEEKGKHFDTFSKFNKNKSRSNNSQAIIYKKEAIPTQEIVPPTKIIEYPELPNSLTSEENGYITSLRAGNMEEIRKIAIKIYRKTDNVFLLDEVEKALLKGYETANKSIPCDAMSWCCKVLGMTRNVKYKNSLLIVSENAPNNKLKKYAIVGLKTLK